MIPRCLTRCVGRTAIPGNKGRRISALSSFSVLSNRPVVANVQSNPNPDRFFRLVHSRQQQQQQIRCFSSSNTDGRQPIDYFDLFGLPRNFGIDQTTMKQTYLKLMTEHHPDKQQQQQQQRSDDENNNAPMLLTAETITHAYQVLRSPHTRALHWLELHGSPLVEESGNANRTSNTNATDDNDDDDTNGPLSFTNQQDLVGMEFLMEIMEWREAIEDAGSDQARLEAIRGETKALHKSCEQALEDAIDGGRSGGTEADQAAFLRDARQLTAQLQYWHRLEQTLKESLDVG